MMIGMKRRHIWDINLLLMRKAWEIVFDIVTDKSVVTQCKCISHCDGKNCANQITWEDKDPKVFFFGHSIAKINELEIAGEKENHG